MRKTLFLFFIYIQSVFVLFAQQKEELITVNDATLVGIGQYYSMDTYLSEEEYSGVGYRLMNERIKNLVRNPRISLQQTIDIQYSKQMNRTKSASTLVASLDYKLNYYYRFLPLPSLSVLTGGGVHAMTGVLYNTRNGNNPASAKLDISLNLSLMAIYNVRIKSYPLTLRYQLDSPLIGGMFAPHFGQSYYEMFSLGNTKGIVRMNSPFNKFALRNYFSVDFPIAGITFRAGYMGSYYKTKVNNLQYRTRSHAFMLGFVREFYSFRKKIQKSKAFKSALY